MTPILPPDKLREILGRFQRDIERHYGGRTVGKTITGEEAVAIIEQMATDALVAELRQIPFALDTEPYIIRRLAQLTTVPYKDAA